MAYSMRPASPLFSRNERVCPEPTGEQKKFSSPFRALFGTDDRRRRRTEMPPGVHRSLGTKAAHTEREKDVPDRFHLTVTTAGRPKSRRMKSLFSLSEGG